MGSKALGECLPSTSAVMLCGLCLGYTDTTEGITYLTLLLEVGCVSICAMLSRICECML